jgi:cell division septation protein DedD
VITIGPSSDSDNPPLAPETGAKADEHEKRIPVIWIPATLSIGLLIAAIYLGGRIVTALPSAKPAVVRMAAPIAAKPLPPEVKAAVATPEPTAESPVAIQESAGPEPLTNLAPDDGVPIITPQAGELYIQVGALDLGMEAPRRFIQRLRKEKLEPHVAPGPKPELVRVLIGPFENRDALNERKAQLETEGIATFVRRY